MRRTRLHAGSGRGLAVAAFFLALGTSLFLLVYPSEVESSTSTAVNQSGVHTSNTTVERTLLDAEGASVLIVLSIAPTIAGLAAVMARARPRSGRAWTLAGAILLWIFSALGAMTIGLFYLPSAGVLTLATSRFERNRRAALVPPVPPPLG